MPAFSAVLFAITGFLLVWLLYLAFKRKTKWKGREVLELAARNVKVESDSFTSRPHPVGKMGYTETEAGNFSTFLRKNLVAFPYFEENRIVIVPVSMGREFGALIWKFNDYRNNTWVSFDKDGNIAVNISKQDYMNYKADLSFDQMCNSLASIFIHFMELHKKGQEIRIIDELDSLRLNIYK